jgi:Fic family protein
MTYQGQFEECWWEPRPGAVGGRRNRQPFPCKAFVPDEIAGWDLSLPSEAVTAVTEATAALIHLNGSAVHLASLEALARQLLRAESLASSRIEGLELSHRRLARATFWDEAHDPKAADVVGNIAAMERAVEIGAAADPFTVADMLAIHELLLRFTLDNGIAGVVRAKQSWIGRSSHSPRDASYVPPPPGYVEPLLDDLCRFMNRDDLPAVVQAAVAHAQFETIHPFADGNGRVGRCLIHAVLIRRGLAPRFVPPISLILAGRARQYIEGLVDFREGRAADWIELFADATRLAAVEAERLADEIEALEQKWIERLDRPRRDSSAYTVLAALPAHPVVDVATVQRLADISDVAAGRLLNRLEEIGIVTRIGDRRRGRVWEARELFDLVNEFEADLQSAG